MNTNFIKKDIERSITTFRSFNFQSNKSYAEGKIDMAKLIGVITLEEAAEYQLRLDNIKMKTV